MFKNKNLYLIISVLSSLGLTIGCTEVQVEMDDDGESERSYINAGTPGGDGPPFSGAVMVDGTLYISGALGLIGGEANAIAPFKRRPFYLTPSSFTSLSPLLMNERS